MHSRTGDTTDIFDRGGAIKVENFVPDDLRRRSRHYFLHLSREDTEIPVTNPWRVIELS